MSVEITAPSPGESITEVLIASWLVEDGSYVSRDAEVAEIESDKATLVVYAPVSGMINLLAQQGATVEVGSVIASIDEDAEEGLIPEQVKHKTRERELTVAMSEQVKMTPLARSIAEKKGIPETSLAVIGKKKITRLDLQKIEDAPGIQTGGNTRPHKRVKMSPLRMKLAERLVSVKNETAMLTTFNEVDMSRVIRFRESKKEEMTEKYGYNMGFISFFAMACAKAFPEFPQVNAAIDGDEVAYYDYADICIAVNTPKGLLAPAIRNVQDLELHEIEGHIRDFSARAKDNRIQIDELRGGTFTITNGGTFGSMLSTPIINPPQSAILGMHKIEERPVAVNGKVEIRPIMYIALSYDHRLIDGKESVGFVMKVKEFIESV